jgi:pimeloyl-ACP methyl ester carboxylesterase
MHTRGGPARLEQWKDSKMRMDESFPADPTIEMSRCCLFDDVEISFAHAGPPDGDLIVLLHGFPEHGAAWSNYMVRLANAGFHVVAPDQCGYGLSDKPSEIADYDLDRLATDVTGLAHHIGHDRFEAWSQPGALTGMINWYRAFLRKQLPDASNFVVTVPTLIIWGDLDAYARPELADRSARLCKTSRVLHVAEATHWVHHEQPERVGALLEELFSQPT